MGLEGDLIRLITLFSGCLEDGAAVHAREERVVLLSARLKADAERAPVPEPVLAGNLLLDTAPGAGGRDRGFYRSERDVLLVRRG
jgi:hypothetical protein